MDPTLVLYGSVGLVGLALAIFVVMSVVSLLRPPQLPDLAGFELGKAALTIAPIPSVALHPSSEDRRLEVQATTPFLRTLRTLTPVPWLPRLGPAPITPLEPSKPRIDIPDLPRLKAATPARPAPSGVSRSTAPATAVAPARAPATPVAPTRAPATTSVASGPPRRQRVRLPTPPVMFASWAARYPRNAQRRVRRLLLVTFTVLVACSGALVAAPHAIDPLCDDYRWFGDDAASSVRQLALDAHDAIADVLSS